MRSLIGVGAILWGLLLVELALGREWVSRDGRFTVEAELLTVDAGQVVLRREGGTVIRVPLDRLSLADVKYVQEALQAAGVAPPANAAPSSAGAVSAPAKEPPISAAPATDAPSASKPEAAAVGSTVPKGPPLADLGRTDWQAAPDPPSQSFDLKPEATVEISLTVGYSRPLVLYPSAPSPFVLLGSDENSGPRQLWDLRQKKAVGWVDKDMNDADKLALSCDGRYLVYHVRSEENALQVWSFAEGKAMPPIGLAEKHTVLLFLDFAGPGRIIVGNNGANIYQVYDVATGRQCGTIPIGPPHGDASQAVSPGGNYLVVQSRGAEPLEIYDIRNGVRAGLLAVEDQRAFMLVGLAFSPDGRELAGFFREGSGFSVQVWNMADGSTASTLLVPEDPSLSLNRALYRGRAVQWLADHSGWLWGGVAVLDRTSGKCVWHDGAAVDIMGVLPRQIVDENRMLLFRKGDGVQTLCLVPIPKEEIARSRAIVAAGGAAEDAGLPPITKVQTEGVREISLGATTWTYRPSVPALAPKAVVRGGALLGNGAFDRQHTFFSRPDSARVAVARRVEDSQAAWKTLIPLPQRCHLYDLQKGEQVAEFAVPFPTELVDLSPEGKLGLFCIDRNKDRLDVWDLESAKHVTAFRPFDGLPSPDRQVSSAAFIDENHVIAESNKGVLGLWKLPECRAIYKSSGTFRRMVGMTQDRQTMAITTGCKPCLVDSLSGKTIGVLAEVEVNGYPGIANARFSPDEKRLAAQSCHEGNSLLIVWDLADGSVVAKSEYAFETYGMAWCGPDHVLLNRRAVSDQADVLVDVERGLVVWNYDVSGGTCIASSPDDRCWVLFRSGSAGQAELAAFPFPEEEVRSLLSQVRLPNPLIGPGAAVALLVEIEEPPQAIPPGWSDLENLEEGLHQHFAGLLKNKQVNLSEGDDVRLVVGIGQKKVEKTLGLGGLFGPPESILLSSTFLVPYVAVVDSRGSRVWSKVPSKDDMKPISLRDCPETMDKAAYIKLQQWEQAAAWLRSVQIPCPLYHPTIHRGFGESVVLPKKVEIRRRPSPSQMKSQGKTARLPTGDRWSQPSARS